MFKVSFSRGRESFTSEWEKLWDAVVEFNELVYRDWCLFVHIYEEGEAGRIYLASWDSKTGVQWSPSDRRAAIVAGEIVADSQEC